MAKLAIDGGEKANSQGHVMKVLTDKTFILAESPRYVDGGVVFTDIDSKKLYRWKNNQLEMIWDKEQITSFIVDRNGGMVFANMQGLYRMRPDGSYYPLAEGLKINDMGVDPKGRIIFGTNYHSSAQSYPLGSLYSYDNEHGMRELDYGYHLSNGIGFSPDGTKMYVCDSSVRTIFEYPYDVETGTCGRKKILIRQRVDDSMPDGMAIDNDGYIWTAQWNGGCVIQVSPEGQIVRKVQVPALKVSALEFTPEGMFITSGAGKSNGVFNNGSIYFTSLDVKGSPHSKSDIPCSDVCTR